jgi:hypothetical protein
MKRGSLPVGGCRCMAASNSSVDIYAKPAATSTCELLLISLSPVHHVGSCPGGNLTSTTSGRRWIQFVQRYSAHRKGDQERTASDQ